MEIVKSEFLGFNSSNESLQRIIGFCTSSESKPTENIKNGSKLTELDTGDVYFYDEDIGWQKVVVGESGGSDLPEVTASDKDKYLHTNSSTGDLEWSAVSGGGAFVVDTSIQGEEGNYTLVCNKTVAEILAEMSAGKLVQVQTHDNEIASYFTDGIGTITSLAKDPEEQGYRMDTACCGSNYSFLASDTTDYPYTNVYVD